MFLIHTAVTDLTRITYFMYFMSLYDTFIKLIVFCASIMSHQFPKVPSLSKVLHNAQMITINKCFLFLQESQPAAEEEEDEEKPRESKDPFAALPKG